MLKKGGRHPPQNQGFLIFCIKTGWNRTPSLVWILDDSQKTRCQTFTSQIFTKNVARDNSDGVTWKAANISDQLSVMFDF